MYIGKSQTCFITTLFTTHWGQNLSQRIMVRSTCSFQSDRIIYTLYLWRKRLSGSCIGAALDGSRFGVVHASKSARSSGEQQHCIQFSSRQLLWRASSSGEAAGEFINIKNCCWQILSSHQKRAHFAAETLMKTNERVHKNIIAGSRRNCQKAPQCRHQRQHIFDVKR